jgi:hypothetical protein
VLLTFNYCVVKANVVSLYCRYHWEKGSQENSAAMEEEEIPELVPRNDASTLSSNGAG